MSRPLPRSVVLLIIAAGTLIAASLGALGVLFVQAQDYRETVQEVCADKAAEGGTECTPAQLKGEPGAKGDPGKDGADGRGIASTECGADGQWIVRYTDDTTDYAAGPCTGDRGPAGASGAPGADGTDGVDGESITGPAGADGTDGRGIASARCDSDTGRWVITYTDDTTADGGECIWRPGLPDPSTS